MRVKYPRKRLFNTDINDISNVFLIQLILNISNLMSKEKARVHENLSPVKVDSHQIRLNDMDLAAVILDARIQNSVCSTSCIPEEDCEPMKFTYQQIG